MTATPPHAYRPLAWLDRFNSEATTTLLQATAVMDNLSPSQLGELYVHIVHHSVQNRDGDRMMSSVLNDAIDKYFDLLDVRDEAELREVLFGINEGLHDISAGQALDLGGLDDLRSSNEA